MESFKEKNQKRLNERLSGFFLSLLFCLFLAACDTNLKVKTVQIPCDPSDISCGDKTGLLLHIETTSFISNADEVAIAWSEHPGAVGYELSLHNTPECNQQLVSYDQFENHKKLGILNDGHYYICVSAKMESGEKVKANNNGVKFTIDRIKPEINAESIPNHIEGPSEVKVSVSDLTATKVTWEQLEGPGKLVISEERMEEGAFFAKISADVAGQYVIKVVAVDEAGNISQSTEPFEYTLSSGDTEPPLPGNNGSIVLSSPQNNSLTVNWDAGSDNVTPTEELEYEVRLSQSSAMEDLDNFHSKGTIVAEYQKNITSFTVGQLTMGTTYYFQVAIKDSSGNISLYKSTSGSTTAIDFTPPLAGGGSGTLITASNIGTTSIDLSWNPATDDITSAASLSYRVYYSTTSLGTTAAQVEAGTPFGTQSNIVAETITNLASNTTYYFNVVVEDNAGNKSIYTELSQSTIPDTTAPIAGGGSGTSLIASNIAPISLDLSWNLSTDDSSNTSNLTYKVYYSTTSMGATVAGVEAGTGFGSEAANISAKTITGLTANTSYFFNVVVTDEAGNKSIYNELSQATPADTTAPTPGSAGAISPANITETTLDLNWQVGSDDVSTPANLEYEVRRSLLNNMSNVADAEGNGNVIQAYTLNNNTYSATGLNPSTTYYFNVIIKDEAGNKSVYTTLNATTLADTTNPAPGASGTLTTSSISATGLDLNWTFGTDNISLPATLQYEVRQSTTNNMATVATAESNGSVIQSYAANINSFTVSSLNPASTYYFTVIIQDEAGNKAIYNTASATTSADSINPVPGNSGTINSASITTTSLDLSFSAGTDNSTGTAALEYEIRQSSANNISNVSDAESNGVIARPYTANDTSHSLSGLTPGTNYFFNVIIKDEAGNKSIYATHSVSTLSEAPPPNPTGAGAVVDSDSQITLNWSSGGGTTSDYRIAYQTGSTAPANCASGTQIGEGSVSGTSHAINGLTHETEYSFRICAINANSTPDVSSGVTVTGTTNDQDAPPNPTGESATVDSDSQITLNWSSGGGTTADYLIAYQTGSTAPANCASGTQIGAGSISGTSHAISGLTHETEYSFRICAINANATPIASSGVAVTATTNSQAAPPNPTGLAATVDSDSQITLNWNSGGGTTADYRIAYQTGATAPANCASGTQIGEGAVSGTSHAVTGLTHETEYSFRVCAINANAAPNVSLGVVVTDTTASEAAPPNPTGLGITVDSDSQVTLNWSSGGGTTSDYRISYQIGSSAPANCASGTQIGEGSISGTSHAISGLNYETEYSFRVCAINANSTPNVSAGVTISGTTNGQPAPPNPTGESATVDSDSQITLNWSSGGGTTADYLIAYQTGSTAPANCASGTQIGAGSISGTSHAISGLTHETEYSFRICAINANATPIASSGVAVTATTNSQAAPPNPTGLAATVDSDSQITLNWNSGGGTTADYRIAYQTGATAPANCASGTQIGEGAVSGTSHAVTGLTHETEYSFRVCAINANAAPNVSSGVVVTGTTDSQVAPPNPTGLGITVNSDSQVTLNWNSGGGSTSDYRISYQTGSTAPANCASGIQIGEGSISGTSHAISGLNHETEYSFRVCAINASSPPLSSPGVTITGTTNGQPAPPNPTGQSATVNSDSQITLNWNSGGGTTADYRIAYQAGGTAPSNCSSGTQIGEGSISGTSRVVTGLNHETQYSFRICAINANATPIASSGVTVSATTDSEPAPPNPTGQGGTVNSASQITLNWNSGGGTTADYRIAYQSGGTAPSNCASGTQISEGAISGTIKAITGLTHQTQYSFRICAINANSPPDVSSGVTVTRTTSGQTAPPNPTGQGSTVNSYSQITLNWNSGGGTTADYRIAYQSGGSAPANCASGTQINEGSISGTSKAISGLTHETTYSFRICAINANSPADVSSGVTVSNTTSSQPAPPNPTGQGGTVNSASQITLNWNSGGGTTADYRIAYQSGDTAPSNCSSGTQIGEGSISGTSKAVTGLSHETQYSFRICAINANATPNASSGVTVTRTTNGQAAPPNPTGQSATVNSHSQITLNWNSGGGTTADYRIAYQSGGTAPSNCSSGTQIGEGSISAASHVITGLTHETQYSFRICAINANSTPNVSSGVTTSGTTNGEPAPPNPTGQSATVNSANQITLNWNSGGGTTDDYRISYQVGGSAPASCSSGTQIGAGSINGTSHSVTGLNHETQYSFRICAINANASPNVSSGVTVSDITDSQAPPPNPVSQGSSAVSSARINVSWTSGGGTTADYRISYQTGASAPANCASGTQIGAGSISGTSHQVTGLLAETQYSFRVCAINANGTPDVSSGVTTTATTTTENFDMDWNHSKTITINAHPHISSNLSNYPIFIALDTTNFPDISTLTEAGYNDIRFTKTDGTPLSFERDYYWNANRANFWVLLDTVSSSAATTIKMYYNYKFPPAEQKSNGQAVFATSNDFVGVWHMQQGTGNIIDSTSNNNDGVRNGPTRKQNALLGASQEFDGVDDYFEVPDHASHNLTNSITISSWFKWDVFPGNDKWADIMAKRDGGTWYYQFYLYYDSTANIGAAINDGDQWNVADDNFSTGTWNHAAVTWDGSTVRFYLNGVADGTDGTNGPSDNSAGHSLFIGSTDNPEKVWFDGQLDETRLYSTAKSADWIKLDYESQKPSTNVVTIAP